LLRNEPKDPGRTPDRRLRHAIVVAGPSGAGKNALIVQLMRGEMQPDVLAALHLRQGEALLVAELDHALWMPSLPDTPEGRTPVLHYDMTHSGLAFGDGFEWDPASQILRLAETATIVNLRPPRDRLIRQWGAAHLNARTVWQVRLRYLLDAVARAIHRMIRRVPRNVRRPRFLWRAVSRRSKHWLIPNREVGALYLERDGLAGLYRSWDAFIRQAEGWTQLRQVDMQPDQASPIGTQALRWKIIQCADAPQPAGAGTHSRKEEPAAAR
jgi:hypothetical protein